VSTDGAAAAVLAMVLADGEVVQRRLGARVGLLRTRRHFGWGTQDVQDHLQGEADVHLLELGRF